MRPLHGPQHDWSSTTLLVHQQKGRLSSGGRKFSETERAHAGHPVSNSPRASWWFKRQGQTANQQHNRSTPPASLAQLLVNALRTNTKPRTKRVLNTHLTRENTTVAHQPANNKSSISTAHEGGQPPTLTEPVLTPKHPLTLHCAPPRNYITRCETLLSIPSAGTTMHPRRRRHPPHTRARFGARCRRSRKPWPRCPPR